MLKNYFITAFRNLYRNKSFSSINILGLAGGLAVCMFIMALIIDQNNFDNFHANGDRIYRVISNEKNSGTYATCPPLLKEELKNNFPNIEDVAKVKNGHELDIRFGKKILPFQGLYADSSFFTLFDFKLKDGGEKAALSEPYSIILNEDSAEKLGVDTENDLGKTIEINNWGSFKITGIIKDIPEKTHLIFDVLISYSSMQSLRSAGRADFPEESWDDTWDTYLYFLLKENASAKDIVAALPAVSKKIYANSERDIEFRLQPLNDVSPSKMLNNEMGISLPSVMLNFLFIIALLVLLTACFNYTNLTVAQALTRAKEIGVRKVMGAKRRAIIFQFIGEAVLMALLAMVLSVAILEIIILPQFSKLWMFSFLDFNLDIEASTYFLFFGFSILAGLLAGILPAIYLSAFEPVKVLKSMSGLKVFSRLGVRKVLMVSQFVIALVFFVTIVMLYQQTKKMLHANYGFEKENIVNLSLQGNDFEKIKMVFSDQKDIVKISGSSLVPATGSFSTTDFSLPESDETQVICHLEVDNNFIENIGVELIAGRHFKNGDITGNSQIIINELAVERAGLETPGNAIGKTILLHENDSVKTTAVIIGVVGNFVHHLIIEKPKPLMMAYNPERIYFANLKIQPENIEETLAFIEKKWTEIDPVHPIEYQFFDEQVNESVAVFEDAVSLLGSLTLVTIIITCMGLLGIASYTVQTRKKEIGIRKVLGADISNVLWSLSKGMIYPIGIAILIGMPIAYFLNKLWLESIADSISINISNMGLGVILMFVLAMGIIVSQAYRIAIKNPVNALRSE